MRFVLCSFTAILDFLTLWGIKSIQGTCTGGMCTFAAPDGITLIVLGVPAVLFGLGTLVIINGTVLFSNKGGKALIERLKR